MALPVATPFSLDDLRGTIYDFAAAGDKLPMHRHDEYSAHMTLVSSGKLKVRTPSGETTYEARDHLYYGAGEDHEFEALEPRTRVTNIITKARI